MRFSGAAVLVWMVSSACSVDRSDGCPRPQHRDVEYVEEQFDRFCELVDYTCGPGWVPFYDLDVPPECGCGCIRERSADTFEFDREP